ncbi:MAG: hypothetical protein CSA45_02985 [Gammaproteobacteria bacterium]|nr:MAG: hypothetical protein CSA45_02985 [Gammaproteobacteria bacterium]
MKKRYHWLLLFIGLVSVFKISGQSIDLNVIYKWRQNGQVHYSYIKPANITDYTILDHHGRRISQTSMPTTLGGSSTVVRPEAVRNKEPTGDNPVPDVSKQQQESSDN